MVLRGKHSYLRLKYLVSAFRPLKPLPHRCPQRRLRHPELIFRLPDLCLHLQSKIQSAHSLPCTVDSGPAGICHPLLQVFELHHPFSEPACRALRLQTKPVSLRFSPDIRTLLHHLISEPDPVLLNASPNGNHVIYSEFCGRRGRRCPQIRDIVRNGEIRLMSDRGNDRRRGIEDCLCDDPLIECPQVLDAASAAADDDGVNMMAVEQPDSPSDAL